LTPLGVEYSADLISKEELIFDSKRSRNNWD